jgi:hypothetical protein
MVEIGRVRVKTGNAPIEQKISAYPPQAKTVLRETFRSNLDVTPQLKINWPKISGELAADRKNQEATKGRIGGRGVMAADRRGEIGGRRENRGTQVHWKRFCVGPFAPRVVCPWGLRWFHVWHNVKKRVGRFSPVCSLRPHGGPEKPEGLVGRA